MIQDHCETPPDPQKTWTTKKFAGPWPRACQIMGLWIITMNNILFFQVSTQTGQFSKQKSTSSHSCCNCCCCCCCCCSNCCFLFEKRVREGGCQGASGSSDRQPNLRRVTFFLHLFLGILRLLIFSYFVQNWSPNSSQNGVHFWHVWPCSSVVNNSKISLFGSLNVILFLEPFLDPLKKWFWSLFCDFWGPKMGPKGWVYFSGGGSWCTLGAKVSFGTWKLHLKASQSDPKEWQSTQKGSQSGRKTGPKPGPADCAKRIE